MTVACPPPTSPAEGAPAPRLPAREFLHPLPLAALLLLVVNDHVFKAWLLVPRWLTGKLSDFAGLFYFPLLLTAGFNTVRWLSRRGWRSGRTQTPALTRRQLVVATAATGFVFTWLELCPWAARLLTDLVSLLSGRALRPVLDPWDLLALLMLPLAYLHGVRFVSSAPQPARSVSSDSSAR